MSAIGGRAENILLILRSFQFDPGCVKTCTSQECAELFSLSSSLSGGRKHFWFSNLRNRDGISTRRLNVGVFTRPRPDPDIGLISEGTTSWVMDYQRSRQWAFDQLEG